MLLIILRGLFNDFLWLVIPFGNYAIILLTVLGFKKLPVVGKLNTIVSLTLLLAGGRARVGYVLLTHDIEVAVLILSLRICLTHGVIINLLVDLVDAQA